MILVFGNVIFANFTKGGHDLDTVHANLLKCLILTL
jgi:hypothetical protein